MQRVISIIIYNLYCQLMGNQNSPQLQQALKRQNELQKTQVHDKMLISPAEAFAIRLTQSLSELYSPLLSKISSIKHKEAFSGIVSVVKDCPVYYLKNRNCIYQGQWLDCLPHGCGRAVYSNQAYYQGQFEKGQIKTEEGLYFFNNDPVKRQKVEDSKSSYYIGGFDNSKFHGKGKIYHKGLFYDGQWVEGKRQGEGIEIYIEKVLSKNTEQKEGREQKSIATYHFQGQFVKGFKEGEGRYSRKVNQKDYLYRGMFRKGAFNGQGSILINGHEYLSGYFVNGNVEGPGNLRLQQGNFKGKFVRNLINGEGRFEYNQKEKPSIIGTFSEQLDQPKQRRKIYCDGKLVVEDNYYVFPLLIIEE